MAPVWHNLESNGMVRVQVRRSVKKSYNRKLSLVLGILHFFPVLFIFIFLNVKWDNDSIIKNNHNANNNVSENNTKLIFLLVSSVLTLISSARPSYSIILFNMIFSLLSIPITLTFLSSLSSTLTYLSSLSSTWCGFQCILSLLSFSMSCQALCCGNHGFTEKPREMADMDQFRREVAATATAVDEWRRVVGAAGPANEAAAPATAVDEWRRVVGALSASPATAVDMDEEEANFCHWQFGNRNRNLMDSDKVNDTRLVVDLPTHDTEGLPSYHEAINQYMESFHQ